MNLWILIAIVGIVVTAVLPRVNEYLLLAPRCRTLISFAHWGLGTVILLMLTGPLTGRTVFAYMLSAESSAAIWWYTSRRSLYAEEELDGVDNEENNEKPSMPTSAVINSQTKE